MNNTEKRKSCVKCRDCALEQPVEDFKTLKLGDTISFPGGVIQIYVCNERFRYITYKHYALIKSVVLLDIDGYSAMISMIQFIWSPYSNSMIIRDITEIKSVYKDEIYKYIYRSPTNSPEIIIGRAEHLLEESKLRSCSILSYNFERMVWWCVFETTQCLQLGVLEKIVQRADDADWKVRKIAYTIVKYRLIAFKILKCILNLSPVPLRCKILMHCLICVYSQTCYYKRFQSNHICEKCYSKKSLDTWYELCFYILSNLDGIGLLVSSLQKVLWLKGFMGMVDETPHENDGNNLQNNQCVFQYEGPFSRNEEDVKLPEVHIDHRRGKWISTNKVKKSTVRKIEEIKPGDLIEFEYHYILFHKAICTEVICTGIDSEVELKYVHYGASGTVIEDHRTFNVKRETIHVYLYHPLHRFPRADIVRRARAKLKEQNYSIFRRRASHFADEIVHRGEDFVLTSFSDIQQGDVIIYSYRALWHEAVVTKVNTKSYEIVHYGLKHFFATREIITEELEIDVKTQVIKKKEFNGYHTYPSMVTVERAMSRIGERRFSIFGNRSDDFVHWCKVVQTPSVYSIQPAVNGKNDKKPIQKVIIIPQTGKVYTDSFHEDWIKTWKELTIGSILYLRRTYGILMSLDETSNTIQLSCYKDKEKRVEQCHFKVDLKKKKESIWVYRCNSPSKCRTPKEIIDRALNRDRYSIPVNATQWKFCTDCVMN